MSIAALIRKMAEAGASIEAVALAVEAIEAVNAAENERRASDALRTKRYREARGLTERAWADARGVVIGRDGLSCNYCGSDANPPHVDHITPLSRGGTNDLNNLTVACAQCNQSKGGKTVDEWRRA